VEVVDLWPIVEMDGAGSNLTVVVPTQDEAANVLEFVRRLEHALTGEAEIVFVDDSRDETPDIIRQAGRSAKIPIRLIHRPPEQRRDGLSGAVVEGLRVARARHVCAIDADLQHPPELLPQMLRLAVDEDLDVVVASRRCNGGSMDALGCGCRKPGFARRPAHSGKAVRVLAPNRLSRCCCGWASWSRRTSGSRLGWLSSSGG